MDYVIENALIVTEKSKENVKVLRLYADKITAYQKKEKEEKENA